MEVIARHEAIQASLNWPIPSGRPLTAASRSFRSFLKTSARQQGALEIEPPRPQVAYLDYRAHAAPQRVLLELLKAQASPQLQIWAEGEDFASLTKKLQSARLPTDLLRARDQLAACQTLLIWNAPPGRGELSVALERCQPERVIVFGLVPGPGTGPDQLQPFLQRLAGLAKHLIAHSDGRVDWARLASAAAQRELSVRLGLEWLEALGGIAIRLAEAAPEPASHEAPQQPQIRLVPGGSPDPARAALLKEQIKDLLDETRSYRAYFRRMDLEQVTAFYS